MPGSMSIAPARTSATVSSAPAANGGDTDHANLRPGPVRSVLPSARDFRAMTLMSVPPSRFLKPPLLSKDLCAEEAPECSMAHPEALSRVPIEGLVLKQLQGFSGASLEPQEKSANLDRRVTGHQPPTLGVASFFMLREGSQSCGKCIQAVREGLGCNRIASPG